MNVLFLDFDGVINSEEMLPQMTPGCSRAISGRPPNYDEIRPCSCSDIVKQFDRRAIVRLNGLIHATSVRVVLSTSWRKLYDVETLSHVLWECGFVGQIIGETPDLPRNDAWRVVARSNRWFSHRIERGHEIAEWLLQNPDVERCMILDDADDMWLLKPCLVQTDPLGGLSQADCLRAVDVLRASGETVAELRQRYAPIEPGTSRST